MPNGVLSSTLTLWVEARQVPPPPDVVAWEARPIQWRRVVGTCEPGMLTTPVAPENEVCASGDLTRRDTLV